MSTIFISHSSRDNALAQELGEQLAKQNHHSVFLDFDPEQGIVAGQSWEQTLYCKLRACRAVIALCTDHYLASQWCFAEIALARMEGKHIIALQVDPLSADAQLPSILTERQFIDLRINPEEGYRRLWKGLAEQDLLGVAGEWDPKKPPYLGLSAYQEEHAPVFFGREEETRAGLELLSRGAPGLIMVLGSSGSGKSSLVRAAMLPRLRREEGRWLVVDPFRPGLDPFIELAESLLQAWRRYAPARAARLGDAADIRDRLAAWTPHALADAASSAPPPDDTEAAASPGADQRILRLIRHIEELRDDPPDALREGLRHFLDWSLEDLRRITGSSAAPSAAPSTNVASTPLVELASELQRDAGQRNARVLLIVDQFEECLGRDDADHGANRFLQLLRASLEADRSPLMALGTMRSDFLGAFQRNAALRSIDFESLSLGPMKLEGMRRVIEEPARLGALELETGLADRLLEDTETPDALPLLSFTLSVLWRDFRADGKLEVREYEQLGGLDGAMEGEADALLASARNEGKEEALREAFLRMARLTDEGSYARQPVAWDAEQLRPVHSILERFVERRLLVTRADGGKRMVEVAHEALFRSWMPLKTWLDNNRAELLLLQQIKRDARTWQESQRAAENLWRGGRLQEARELLGKGRLPEPETDFIRAGLRRRQVQRLTVAGSTLAVIAVLAVFLVFALLAADRANKATAVADSGRLAGASMIASSERPDRAALLAIEALRKADTFDARNALLLSVQSNPAVITVLDNVAEFAFATDELLATGREDGELQLWRLGDSGPTPIGEPLAQDGSPISRLAASPAGTTLASGTGDGNVQLWRVDGSVATPLGAPLASGDSAVRGLAFSRDGETLATGNGDGRVQLWRLDESGGAAPLGDSLDALGGSGGGLSDIALSPDGRALTAGGSWDDMARLWRLDDSGVASIAEPLGPHLGSVVSVAFSPSGKTLASSGSSDDVMRLWRLDESGAARPGTNLSYYQNNLDLVWDVAFVTDEMFATGSRDGSVRLWRLDESGPRPLSTLLALGGNHIHGVAFSPGGRMLGSISDDGTVRLLHAVRPDAQSLGAPLEAHQGRAQAVAYASNNVLAAANQDGSLELLNVDYAETTSPGSRLELGNQGGDVWDAALTRDGKILATASNDGSVRLWRLEDSSAKPLGEPLAGDGAAVRSIAISDDARTLASGSDDGKVRLWRLGESGATSLGEPLEGHTSRAGTVAFAPDGRTLASGSHDGTVRLWRLTGSGAASLGEPLDYDGDQVYSVAFSPDGTTLAAGGFDGGVLLWWTDGSGSTRVRERLPPQGSVSEVAFSPDAKFLASGLGTGTVRLWWLNESGATQLGESLVGDGGAISSIAFSPDGNTLAASSADYSSVWVWRLGIESWRAAACRRTGSNLSLTEWNKYLGANEPYRCTCPGKGPGRGIEACPSL